MPDVAEKNSTKTFDESPKQLEIDIVEISTDNPLQVSEQDGEHI